MNFQEYFAHKLAKLEARDLQVEKKSEIFKGFRFYITGRTEPSAATLRRLVIENGGAICSFYGRKSDATHVIAENLSLRKAEVWKNVRVVPPSFVTDRVKRFQERQDAVKPKNGANDKLVSDPYPGPDVILSEDGSDPDLSLDAVQDDASAIAWIKNARKRVNCLDPNFLKSYFSRSRLHYISSRKAELRRRFDFKKLLPAKKRTILHIDFDSFFVSVALRSRPALKDKPVCVSHGSPSSDVASCNYVARAKGVSNGMWVASARQLCPDLVCLDYEFDRYTECSDALYEVLATLQADSIVPLSVDECLVDITSSVSEGKDVAEVCESIRRKVYSKTGINVSIGAGANILQARIALRLAKPAGQYIVTEDPRELMAKIPIRDLPGIGPQTEALMRELGVETAGAIANLPRSKLNTLPNKLAAKLTAAAVGEGSDDISTADPPPQTAGLEVAWGVRVIDKDELMQFAQNVANEALKRCLTRPLSLTVRIHRKRPDAPFVPPKFMGCGPADVSSRSRSITTKENIVDTILGLVASFDCPPLDFRGMGVHFQLENLRKRPAQLAADHFFKKPRSSANKHAQMVRLEPRRRANQPVSLTQMLCPKPRVDVSILRKLPKQMQQELLNDCTYEIPSRAQLRMQLHRREPAETYVPISFAGRETESELRALVASWVRSAPAPYYEDVTAFKDFVGLVLVADWNWMKALNLIEWLGLQVRDKGEKWKLLHRLMTEYINTRLPALC